MTRAASLVRSHRLRGFDVVHLAAALEIRKATAEETGFRFAAADDRLSEAARSEGCELLELEDT